MTNEQALELLDHFIERAQEAVQASVWAGAFLTQGGEATWDAVKSVSGIATSLIFLAEEVEKLRERYDDITPF